MQSNEISKKNMLKRESNEDLSTSKRAKTEKNENSVESEVMYEQKLRKKNFVEACEIVSYKAYFDRRSRLQLTYLPNCTIRKHQDKDMNPAKKIPSYAEESFKIEMKSNMWAEALEVCFLTITPQQYLPPNILQDVVEIMMNAHNDENSDKTVEEVIDSCQQVLSLHFSTHPPVTKSLSKCYNAFLTSSMSLRQKTFTDRAEFEYDKGIVKYCFNRLEYEISIESKDTPLVDKLKNTPEDMKDSVQGFYWQKEKFEIFELLNRNERIMRLMLVLESIVELLKFDIAIWLSRYSDTSKHITRPSRPLIAVILWPNNVPYHTGAMNKNCKQILRLFVHFIHLKYPEQYIKIMMSWLTVIIEAFYICETNPNSDYPNTGLYCSSFAHKFYDVICEMPPDSIIRILERIHPNYMRQLVGVTHIKRLLKTKLENILEIIKSFVLDSQWTQFPEKPSNSPVRISKLATIKPKKVKNISKYLLSKCRLKSTESQSETVDQNSYLKFDPTTVNKLETEFDLNHVIHTMYLTSEAYLDTYSLHNFQDTFRNLNKNGEKKQIFESNSYYVTNEHIKKYKSMCEMLTEVTSLLTDWKNKGQLPEILFIFENIGLIDS